MAFYSIQPPEYSKATHFDDGGDYEYVPYLIPVQNTTPVRRRHRRMADACLGSSHPRNSRGCRRNEAANATQYVLPSGTIKQNSRVNEQKEKKNEPDPIFFYIRHSSIAINRAAAAAAARWQHSVRNIMIARLLKLHLNHHR